MIELATFAPHRRPRRPRATRNDFPGLTAPRTGASTSRTPDAPRWLSGHPPLTPAQIARIDALFRKRAQSIQAVDDMIGRIEATLKARGLDRNTYIVFSSDNGFHLGQHRLLPGQDDRVRHGHPRAADRRRSRRAGRQDHHGDRPEHGPAARPSASSAGARVPRERGRAQPRAAAARTARRRDWRRSALVEHHGPDFNAHDPDLPPRAAATRPHTRRCAPRTPSTSSTPTASASTTTSRATRTSCTTPTAG